MISRCTMTDHIYFNHSYKRKPMIFILLLRTSFNFEDEIIWNIFQTKANNSGLLVCGKPCLKKYTTATGLSSVAEREQVRTPLLLPSVSLEVSVSKHWFTVPVMFVVFTPAADTVSVCSVQKRGDRKEPVMSRSDVLLFVGNLKCAHKVLRCLPLSHGHPNFKEIWKN